MKQHLKKLTPSASLSLIIATLLLFTISITVNNALTGQEKRTRAASNNSSAYNTPIPNCSPRQACLDATPQCSIPEPKDGWCPKKSTLGESSSAVVTFADNGLSEPFYWLTSPTAVYYNGKTYVVWHGTNFDPYITYYDHVTKTWAPAEWVGDSPLVDDGHGAPSLQIDNSGYIYVFYGSHLSNQKWAKSTSPESISNFTIQPDIVGEYTYPKPIKAGDSMYLFLRVHPYESYRIWTGTSWGPANNIISAESPTTDFVYTGFMEYNDNKIHMTWTYTYTAYGNRHNVFYAYLNLADSHMYSASGVDLGTMITTAEAETYCMVRNTGSNRTTTPALHIDSSGNPWIIYIEGTDPTYRFYHTRWTGSAWTAPVSITTTDDVYNYEDFKINSVTDVTAYLNTAGLSGGGGDIEQWHWDGSAWSKVSTILSESASGKPLGDPNIPYHANGVDLVFNQYIDDIFTDNTLKLYAVLGTSSTPTPTLTPTPTPVYVTPTLYCLGLSINKCLSQQILTRGPTQIQTTPNITGTTPPQTQNNNFPIVGGAFLLIPLILGATIYYLQIRRKQK